MLLKGTSLRGLLSAIGLFVLGGVAAANACMIPPEAPSVTARALVDRTSNVIVGDVQSARIVGYERRYRIKVVERLKGNAPETVEVVVPIGFRDTAEDLAKRFAVPAGPPAHESAAFWVGESPAGFITSMCAVSFDPRRGRHVIFVDPPFHLKGFEPIADLDDSWYLTVKRMVGDPKLEGRIVGPDEFVRLFFAVYRFACENPGQSSERCGEPRRLWGAPVDFRALNPTGKIYPGACRQGADAGCEATWVFLSRPYAEATLTMLGQPFGVRVRDGKLTFDARYKDLVLSRTEIGERELLDLLQQAQ